MRGASRRAGRLRDPRSGHRARADRQGLDGARVRNSPMREDMRSAFKSVICAHLAMASLASAQGVDQLTPHKVKLESVDYLGKRAVKITEDGAVDNGEAYAIVKEA